jgi:competence protein ComEC
MKYFWGLLTVTIAAQAGVLPLSLFYFHQFPGLFFLTNLLILPFLGFILIFGIVIIALALLNILPAFVANLYEGVIQVLNAVVAKVAQQEQFLFKDISFGLYEALAAYLLLFLLVLLIYSFSYRRLVILLLTVVVLQAVMIFKNFSKEEKLLVFHKSRESFVAKQDGDFLAVYATSDAGLGKAPVIGNFSVGEDLKKVTFQPLQNVLSFKDDVLLVIDSTGVFPQQNFQPEYLLLVNSPRINLERLIQQLNPNQIIADGSNYKSLVAYWKQTSAKKEIPFHYTGEKGAFIVK